MKIYVRKKHPSVITLVRFCYQKEEPWVSDVESSHLAEQGHSQHKQNRAKLL